MKESPMDVKVELHKRVVKYPTGEKAYWTLRWRGTDGRRYSESLGAADAMTRAQAQAARREKEALICGGKLKRNRPRETTLAEFVKQDRETIRGTVKADTEQSIDHAVAHAK